jgi:hypothetical protein
MGSKWKLTFALALVLFFIAGFYAGSVVEMPNPMAAAGAALDELNAIPSYPKYPPVDPTGAGSATGGCEYPAENVVREVIEQNDHYILLETVDGKAQMPLIDGCPLYYGVIRQDAPTDEETKAIVEQREYWCGEIKRYIESMIQLPPPREIERIEGYPDLKVRPLAERLADYEKRKTHYTAQLAYLEELKATRSGVSR